MSSLKHQAQFRFRLYLADHTPNSALALANLTALCRMHLAGRYEIEVIDVLKKPQRAQADGILMTPTLVKLAPSPPRKIVGTLTRTQIVMQTLGLEEPIA